MRLNELFNKPYSYQLAPTDIDEWDAWSALPDGTDLQVNFAVIRDERVIRFRDPETGQTRLRRAPAQWEIGFYKDGDDDPSQEGDEFRIFATVMAAVKEFMKLQEPSDIVFRAKQNQSDGRIRLYRRFLKKLEAQGWNTREEADPGAVSFYADRWRNK